MKCSGCRQKASVGGVSSQDTLYYCRQCWAGFPSSLRMPCQQCHKKKWVEYCNERAIYCCRECSESRTGPVPAAESPQAMSPSARGTSCSQCKKLSVAGFFSLSAKGKYYCTPCWRGFPSADKAPCELCKERNEGYLYDGGDKPQFLCSLCISIFERRKKEEDIIKKQQEEDAALLAEEISYPDLALRAGCQYLDRWFHSLLLTMELSLSEQMVCEGVANDVTTAMSASGLCVEVYGSRRTGIVTHSSDFDFYVRPKQQQDTASESSDLVAVRAKKRIEITAEALRCAMAKRTTDGDEAELPCVFSEINVVNAKVPLVKCVHKGSGAQLDFSFTPVGVLGSDFLCSRLQLDSFARPLTVIAKVILSSCGLDDANDGGLGSFAVANMVLWYVRQKEFLSLREQFAHDDAQAAKQSPAVKPKLSLTLVVMNFLDYFSNVDHFDYRSRGIDVLENRIVTAKAKYCKSAGGICVRHPIDRDSNAANGCDKFVNQIAPRFAEIAQRLNALARMKYVMKSSVHFAGVDEFLFAPVAQALRKYGKKLVPCQGSSTLPPLRPQNLWTEGVALYIGGLEFQ